VTTPNLGTEMLRLSRELATLQRRITMLERGANSTQLDQSSIENGALTINDANGNPQIILGLQADGTFAHLQLTGSTPPQPSDPVLYPAVNGLNVSWDGNMSDGSPPLADFAGVQVHCSTQANFIPGSATLQFLMGTAGTRQITGLTPDTLYYVLFIVTNQAGMQGPTSDYMSAIAQGVVDQIPPSSITPGMVTFQIATPGGVNVAIGPNPPGAPNPGDLWFDATNGYVMNQWNGTAWLPYQFGHNAIVASSITSDLIAGNQIVAGLVAAGAIDGMTINGLTINGTTINASNLLISGTTGGIYAYSQGGTTTQTFYASGTWIAPPGVTTVRTEGLAPGGGGAYGTSTTKAGGGDGGEYSLEPSLAVTPGRGYAFTIGSPGGQGILGSVNGGNGGQIVFPGDAVSLVANGGRGGLTTGSHATPVYSTNTTHHPGGLGYAPTVNGGPSGHGGGGAGSAGPSASGNNAPNTGYGASAVPGGGSGGNGFGGGSLNDSGDVGGGYGGGGGAGPSGGHVGAYGQPGWLRLTFTPTGNSLVASLCGLASTDPLLGLACPAGFEVFNNTTIKLQGQAGESAPGQVQAPAAEQLQLTSPKTLSTDVASALLLQSVPTGNTPAIYGNGLNLMTMAGYAPSGATSYGRASTTTLAADPYLSINCLANAIYDLDMVIFYSGAASGGSNLKFTMVSPSGTEIDWLVPVYMNTSNAPVYNETSYIAPTKIAYTNGTANPAWGFQIVGTVFMGSVAGPVQFWWAQGTSSGTNTRIFSGSRMSLTQIG